MKISVVCPVLNEVDFIGYSIMAGMPYIHEFIYALDEKSDDGTRELLWHVKEKYAHEKLVIINTPNFHPHDMGAYNDSFNTGIQRMTGDAAMFLHPDMLITKGQSLDSESQAWWVTMTSYAGDFQTKIVKGRATKWKNIHLKNFGLHYYGGYGSENEDFYHKDITGNSYRHYNEGFDEYPFKVSDSGFEINHYCELKDYKRRLEKMKLCIKTLKPHWTDARIQETAINHPRVTLEYSTDRFGRFEFQKTNEEIPSIIKEYKSEFSSFKREPVLV